MEKGNIEEARDYYKKAMAEDDNKFSKPLYMSKAAFAHEQLGNYEEAIELYEMIQVKYPNSNYSDDAAKSIARLNVLKNQS